MGLRHESREMALKALYLIDVSGIEPEEALEIVKRGEHYSQKLLSFAEELVLGTAKNIEKLDELIVKYSANWTIGRMATIDRNVLRLGSYELLEMKDTPVKVIIDEAIELAKKYSKEDSNKFVNGILDKIKDAREMKS